MKLIRIFSYPDRRADEVQERVQVQDRLRRSPDGHGPAAGLRERRVGPGQGHQVVRPHSRHPRGSSHLRRASPGNGSIFCFVH